MSDDQDVYEWEQLLDDLRPLGEKMRQRLPERSSLPLDAEGRFDVVISPERPAGWDGAWWALHPECEKFMLRIVGCAWGDEREPRFGIDRLDAPAAKGARCQGRPTLPELADRFREIPFTTQTCALAFPDKVEQMRNGGLLNTLKVVGFSQMTGLQRQSYYEGAYDLADDEALITEVQIPEQVGYWSLTLSNELYETTDWYNNQSSLNDAQAVVDGDRVFRAVISTRDPGIYLARDCRLLARRDPGSLVRHRRPAGADDQEGQGRRSARSSAGRHPPREPR